MEVPLTEFTAIDLERELYAYGLNKEGTKQERYERLFTARHKLNYPHLRPRRPAISKFGARVQLDDFAEIRVYRQAECDILASKLKWRIEQVRRTEDNESLEYFHPELLERIDRRKTYMINMEEFVVRKNPYVHKIFTIFVSRTTGEDLTLLYARSMVQLATMEEVDSDSVDLSLVSNDKKKGEEVKRKVPEKAIISPQNIAKALGYILRELKKKTITNYVGVVCDYTRMHMKVVTELIESSGLQMPPLVDDIRDLQRALRNMFAPTSVRIASLLVTELYTEATYNEQMSTICNKNTTKDKTAVAPLDEFIVRLSNILRDMWKHEEHEKKSISLVCLNNKMVKIYGRHVSRELPPITYEDCAAGAGLLQLMVFDALWCITPELEPEEIYANPTVSSHAS